MQAISFEGQITLPVFVSDIDCVWVPYQVKAALIHLGPRVDSGHYRALLSIPSADEVQWLYTDDHTVAQSTPVTLEHQQNCYLLWLEHSSESALGSPNPEAGHDSAGRSSA